MHVVLAVSVSETEYSATSVIVSTRTHSPHWQVHLHTAHVARNPIPDLCLHLIAIGTQSHTAHLRNNLSTRTVTT